MWVVARHQYGLSAHISQSSFRVKTGGITKYRLFSYFQKWFGLKTSEKNVFLFKLKIGQASQMLSLIFSAFFRVTPSKRFIINKSLWRYCGLFQSPLVQISCSGNTCRLQRSQFNTVVKLKDSRHKRSVVVRWCALCLPPRQAFRRLSGEHGRSEKGESWRQARSAWGVWWERINPNKPPKRWSRRLETRLTSPALLSIVLSKGAC